MYNRKSKFERYNSSGAAFKTQQLPSQLSPRIKYQLQQNNSGLNKLLTGNMAFDCQQIELKFQNKIKTKFISFNRYSLWNLLAYYLMRIIQSLSDTDRVISDLIYFIIMFVSLMVLQIIFIRCQKLQDRKTQYSIFFIISCFAYINILCWQKIYVDSNSPCSKNYRNAYENMDILLNEYQILFLMLYWQKWFWKCIAVISITIFQSVLIFDERFTQCFGIILMIIFIVTYYMSELDIRITFIHQSQKYRNLKQLVEIMNTKLPIGIAILQKKQINLYEQQAEKFLHKTKLINDLQSPSPQLKSMSSKHIESQQEIRSLKSSIQGAPILKPKKSVVIDQSIGNQMELQQQEDVCVDIRFINSMLFSQVFSTIGAGCLSQNQLMQKGIDTDDYKLQLSGNNSINKQGSGNNFKGGIHKKVSIAQEVLKFKLNKNHQDKCQDLQNKLINLNSQITNKNIPMNGCDSVESNILQTKDYQFSEANFVQPNNTTEGDYKQPKSNDFNLKSVNTQLQVHAFLESLQIPQPQQNRQNNESKNFFSCNNYQSNANNKAFSTKQQDEIDESIGFYTNLGEARTQQNTRMSGQKSNFKQLIYNFFSLNSKDGYNQQKYMNLDKIYYNCQQQIERPRKETKPDIRLNAAEDNTKQYDIKITSIILDGEPALILMINDSTDRFMMKQMKESSDFKSQLLNYIQHIAKTPLNSIIQLSETMEQWFPLQPNNKQVAADIKDNLDIIKKNGLILHHQVQSIIDLQQINCNSKISLKTDLIDLFTIIREVEELFETEIDGKKLKFDIKQTDENIEMQTDENRLTQILIEMIGNSVKFTRENDSISIEISVQKTYAVSLICISIIDTGLGMTPEQVAIINSSASLENINLPSTHFRQGPGIGLEVSRKLIGLLGPFSKFNLKSTLGEGSSFKFWLYLNLNEKEFAEKSNNMMRKTSDLILEKKEHQSFEKFVISNKLQHMEIMVDPFSLHPNMMYSNKDLNIFLQTRRSSKFSAHSSYSPRVARQSEFQAFSQINSHNQLSQLQNQFLQEQQILQAQIMKKRSLYRVKSPQIVIRKRDMTVNSYLSDQQKNPLLHMKYMNYNSSSNINKSEQKVDINSGIDHNDDQSMFNNQNIKSIPLSINNTNKNIQNNDNNPLTENMNQIGESSYIIQGNGSQKQKTQINLPNESLDQLIKSIRKFGRQNTLQIRGSPSSKFQRSNRKFLSNSYQLTFQAHNSSLSPCIKHNSNRHSSQNLNFMALSTDVFNKNQTAYFNQSTDSAVNNNKIRSESQFKQVPKRNIQIGNTYLLFFQIFPHKTYYLEIDINIIYFIIQFKQKNSNYFYEQKVSNIAQSNDDQFIQQLKKIDPMYKSLKMKDDEDELEQSILDEEEEEIESKYEDNQSIQQQKEKGKQKTPPQNYQKTAKYGLQNRLSFQSNQSVQISHNLIQNSKLSFDKQYLISPVYHQNNIESTLNSQNWFDGLEENSSSAPIMDIRNFHTKSNTKVFTPTLKHLHQSGMKLLSPNRQENQQFTFNTIKCTNHSRHSLQSSLSNQYENEDNKSIISLHSNKFNRSYEKSHYRSLTNISSNPSPQQQGAFQSPRIKKRFDKIIEVQAKKNVKEQSKELNHNLKIIDLQNTLFKLTIDDQKNNGNTLPSLDNETPYLRPTQPITSGVQLIQLNDNKHNIQESKRMDEKDIHQNREEQIQKDHSEDKKISSNLLPKIPSKVRGSYHHLDVQLKNTIYSLDDLNQDKANVSIESRDALQEGNINNVQTNLQLRQKKRLKNQSTFESSHFNIANKMNVLESQQIHSSQLLDDQKLNLQKNTPAQSTLSPGQQTKYPQNANSRSSLGNKQIKMTLNTIMSHDIDQDIFDTLFPQDTLLLIVDDTIFNRIVLKQMFKSSQNLVIHEAINGQDAIDKIRILKETTNRTYNLIFMDLNMPVMDGFEALKQIQNLIKANYIPWLPVVAVTAYDTEVENCRNKGFDGFISKPIRIKEMVRTLIRIISIRKVEDL